ncbi:beta-galactosidase [Paenibacillus harenae]|uniref:beta-galactosidase n=1 Tax=Paenibacillus harenae TaxID=306543 RepID=UPI0003FB299A|nr:beta-galactosidase [Paenibacillus harenae]
MVFQIPAEAFQTESGTVMETLGEGGFRMITTPGGGGLHLDASACPDGVWTDYDYMGADVYHESHDVLVLLFKFTDVSGRWITVHYGILPRIKTRIWLPLSALNGEKLFLERSPGVMQSVLRGDAFVDRYRIALFELSTIPSVKPRSVHISGLILSESVIPLQYEASPYIDELGQLVGKEWDGKMQGAEELVRTLREEWQLSREGDVVLPNLGRYGGWKQLRFEASGFFRTEHDGERWWFVDPDGYALFSTGMDCIHPAETMRVSGMEHLLPELPARDGEFRDAWNSHGYSFGIANLIRAFGDKWRDKWADLTEYRMKSWGMNTIGNWSNPEYIDRSELPYVYPMDGFPSTSKTIFRDFPDVYDPEYDANAAMFAGQLTGVRDDPRLIGYFMRNEPHWAFVDNLNLTEQMLRSPVRFTSKERFVDWLKEKYASSVEALNDAWGSSFDRFEQLCEGASFELWQGSSARSEDFSAFNRLMIRRYVEVPAKYCKEADPNHLNLGMRYAWVGSDDILEGCEAFDVFSINCYQFEPDRAFIDHIGSKLNKPLMIGEFHFGAADAGMLAYGIRAVPTQADRGLAYQYFVEHAASIPDLIGVHYFQLNDQAVLGRFDGENYQIGAVDGCQQPYRPFVEAMRRTHKRMYDIRLGHLSPSATCPTEIPKTGF